MKDLQIDLAYQLIYLSVKVIVSPITTMRCLQVLTVAITFFGLRYHTALYVLWFRLLERIVTEASPIMSTMFGTWSSCSSISAE